MEPMEIAQVCHEANRALQIIQADPTIEVSPPWDELDTETKWSAHDGVLGVLSGNTPEQSHNAWSRFKFAKGWTWGKVKDLEKREHPLLVPYSALPESAKIKDELFVAVVKALA